MAELKFEIVKEFGVLSQSPSGWTKELNLVSWNDREPKYDIREWAPEHTKMGKGVTISADEIILLRDLLNEGRKACENAWIFLKSLKRFSRASCRALQSGCRSAAPGT